MHQGRTSVYGEGIDIRLRVTVNTWREIFERIYTHIYTSQFKIPIKIIFSKYHREPYALLKQKAEDGVITQNEFITMVRAEMGLEMISDMYNQENKEKEPKEKDDDKELKEKDDDKEPNEKKKENELKKKKKNDTRESANEDAKESKKRKIK